MRLLTTTTVIAALAMFGSAQAATLTSGYTTGGGNPLLTANGGAGDVMFTDTAAPGGNQDPVNGGTADFNAALLPGTWNVGDTVTITGLAFVLKGNNMGSGNFTFSIREGLGGSGASGAGGFPPVLGSATASYTTTGTVETMYVNFDTPITFVADANSTTVGIQFAFDGGNVAIKAGTDISDGLNRYNVNNGNIVGGGTPSYQRWSVAGSVTPVPEPGSLALLGLGGLMIARRRRA